MKQINFSEDFHRAIETWRRKHGLREDDAIMLCLDLFRIHQEHWDKIRHEELPAFREYREMVLKLGEAAATFQRQSRELLDELRVSRTAKSTPGKVIASHLLTATIAGLVGFFIRKLFL